MRWILLFIITIVTSVGHAISVNYTVQIATCGECNGGISTSITGGLAPYTILWSPAPAAGQGTNIISGLCPGIWDILVTDANGDDVTVSIEVPDLPGLNIAGALAASAVYAACPGSCTGQFMINENILGGAAPYTYATNPTMPLNAICGDVPFDLTITDANGCTGIITTMVPEMVVPSLLFTELIGNCGEAPTSALVHFDLLPASGWITLMPPNGTVQMFQLPGNNIIQFTGPIPGTYGVAIDLPGCPSAIYYVDYPAIITDCATVSGNLFVDVNGDCINNAGDFGLANRVVNIAPGHTALSGPTGNYQRSLPDGTYDLSVTDPVYSQDCPIASPVNFTVDEFTPATIDLAFTPGPDPDVEVSLVLGAAVVGFAQNIWITVTNNGGVPSGPITLTLDHDPLITYCQYWICIIPPYNQPVVFPYPTSFVPGQLTWDLSQGLAPGQSRMMSASLCLPPDPMLLGTVLDYTATASLLLNDADPSNNTSSNTETIVGSYDPNDKIGRTTSGSTSEWSIENDSLIIYTIRFQNTGTAPAVNVVLVDTISPDLDLSSLKILGASHTYSTSLNDRVLSFNFDHIMLPDSNANEPGSHGFAQFSIRPVAMVPGSSVGNFADIYFDFNPPIRTNTSAITAPLITGITTNSDPSYKFHPNPGTDHFTIQLPPGEHALKIFDQLGRSVMQLDGISDRAVIGTTSLPPGIYTVRITDRKGRSLQQRWIKE